MEKILNGKKNKRESRGAVGKKTGGELIAFVIVFVILSLFALSYIFAFLWAIFAATKTHDQVLINPFDWHKIWNFKNYIDIFSVFEVRGIKMPAMIFNSLWFTISSAALTIMGSALMAYAIAKFQFIGKKLLISVNFIVMTLPVIGALPASYKMISTLRLVDSPLLLITRIGTFGAYLLILMSFFRNLSDEYREAAVIDGAGEYKILFMIIFPLARGPVFALFIMNIVAVWNDYMTALLYLPNMPTLSTGVYLFRVEMIYRARMDLLLAATVITAIPPLILYLLFNKSILTNVSIGGIKG
ncbi:sugar ABC transporter permease [Clostridia bacterium]|nr:sugar ABC transporter permease [Clostridia bacterium]